MLTCSCADSCAEVYQARISKVQVGDDGGRVRQLPRKREALLAYGDRVDDLRLRHARPRAAPVMHLPQQHALRPDQTVTVNTL